MVRPKFDIAKDRKWRKIIADWQASGLNMSAFCRRENVKLGSLCDWRRVIQRRDAEMASKKKAHPNETVGNCNNQTSGEEFARVVLTGQPAKETSRHALEICLRNGVTVSVQENCSPSLLSVVVTLLEARNA